MYVLLLKSAGEWASSPSDDPYVQILTKDGFKAELLETLDFEYHTDALDQYKNWRDNHSCIVFTSPRAVIAYTKAGLDGNENDLCFVVGPSTETLAKKAGFEPKGAASGDANNLSKLVVNHFASKLNQPTFFPAGQVHHDVFPKALEAAGYSVNTVIAYSSRENNNLQGKLQSILKGEGPIPNCIVFFSPSGVTLTEQALQLDVKPNENVKLVAMGRTTASRLEEIGMKVSGVATSPKPESLLSLLKSMKR